MAATNDPLAQILAALADLQQQNAILNQKVQTSLFPSPRNLLPRGPFPAKFHNTHF